MYNSHQWYTYTWSWFLHLKEVFGILLLTRISRAQGRPINFHWCRGITNVICKVHNINSHCLYFNWFIVLRSPLAHALLCERVCISHCYSATIATQLYCTAVSFLNIHRLRLAAPTRCWTKTVQEGDQLLARRVPGPVPGTYLRDQISFVGFLQQPSFEDESSLLVLPSSLLFNTGDQTKLLATCSCIHGVFCGSRSAENRWSYLSPKTSGFRFCLLCKRTSSSTLFERRHC